MAFKPRARLTFTLHTDIDIFVSWLKHATQHISNEDITTPDGRRINVQSVKVERRETYGSMAIFHFNAVVQIKGNQNEGRLLKMCFQ